jgi:SAM-dependent methyltransferase
MKQREYATMFEMEDAHWWYLGHRRLYFTFLEKYCPQAACSRVLDAGCGTGGTTKWYLDTFHPSRLEAIELSEEGVSRCRQRGLEGIRRCSVEDIPFPDKHFDLVLCLNVLYHLEVKSDLGALVEMRRVLAPGGYILISLPALKILRGRHDLAVEGIRRYHARDVGELLKEAGFEPVRITYFSLLLLPVMVLFRLLRKPREGVDARSDFFLPSAPVNRLLEYVLALETRLARSWNLPLGSSLVALARNPEGS